MTQNLGTIGRLAYLAVGAAALTVAARTRGGSRTAWRALALASLGSGLLRYCLIRGAMGIDSAHRRPRLSVVDQDDALKQVSRLPRRGDQEFPPGTDIAT